MRGEDLEKVFQFLFRAAGAKKSSIFARWSVFAIPISGANGPGWTGFKVMAYRGVDSMTTRYTKMALNHALSCLTAGVASGASGLGGLGDGLSGLKKYGDLKDAFNVDVGAIQLASVLKSKKPRDIENAIICSGKLLMTAVVRIDKASGGGCHIRCRFVQPGDSSVLDWTLRNIGKFKQFDGTWLRKYTVWPNGIVLDNKQKKALGNWKTKKFA